MFQVDLQWLDFPVSLEIVEAWIKVNTNSGYLGNSADTDLTLWFAEDPTAGGDATNIQAYWSSLIAVSPEATGYKTKDQIAADAAAAKDAALASATTKLEALGLSADEIKAILGQ